MAAPSLTYTLTNGTTADASAVMQNFSDLLNGITDGTRDLTINNLTANGALVLGATSADNLTFNGTIVSDLLPTDSTYDLGSATKNFVEVHLDNAATDGGAIYFNSGTTSFLKCAAAGTSLGYGAIKNGIQAWVNFNGQGVLAIADSYNVTSVTDNGVGDYTVNFTVAFADTNYIILGLTSTEIMDITGADKTASTHRFTTRDNAGTATDGALNYVAAIGAR